MSQAGNLWWAQESVRMSAEATKKEKLQGGIIAREIDLKS